MLTRIEIEENERCQLAPFAMKSADSKGRTHPEAEHPLRTAFQRDKDRIIHSTAFRRLEYKTQVFLNYEGDHYRTRLTHTAEVGQISRTLARSLRLNEDLTEAIALGHDIGHTCFGHVGEEVLSDLLRDEGGFEHNAQALRIVEYFEQHYPAFPGLNLTYEVREGLMKNRPPYSDSDLIGESFRAGARLLEAQLVDLADEIAYNSHDLDDGLESELLRWEDLLELSIWQAISAEVEKSFGKIDKRLRRYQGVRFMINRLVTDALQTTKRNLLDRDISSVADVRDRGEEAASLSPEVADEVGHLEEFLHQNLYAHPQVKAKTESAKEVLRGLFDFYSKSPDSLPPRQLGRADRESIRRIIADYLAGMTDRFALERYRLHVGPVPQALEAGVSAAPL